MRIVRRLALGSAAVVLPFIFVSTSVAGPPEDAQRDRNFLVGANHHLGDTGFITITGKTPAKVDEHDRVRDHFLYVRKLLSDRTATRPDLEPKRKQILAHFDDYIAKDITPLNAHVPWRTPVFIDDGGTICAVGYLIEQTAGRDLAEKIAASHRYDYLEDIAAAMPEVRTWVAESGFTLEELASIQPGYEIAEIDMWTTWDFDRHPVQNGPYDEEDRSLAIHGAFKAQRMDGEWTIKTKNGTSVGHGTFKKGAGTWTSTFLSGAKLAQGPFEENVPHGTWQFFHESGNLAAEGKFRNGFPNGQWTFFYDNSDKTPIAKGKLGGGIATGKWQHFDANGKEFAISVPSVPKTKSYAFDNGQLLTFATGSDKIVHQMHTGRAGQGAMPVRLDMYARGAEKLYVVEGDEQNGDAIYDAGGHLIGAHDGRWTASACKWTPKQKAAAKRGDAAMLHALLREHRYGADEDKYDGSCGDPKPVAEVRVAEIVQLLAEHRVVRAQSPAFVKKLALGTASPGEAEDRAAEEDRGVDMSVDADDTKRRDDLAETIGKGMAMYVEWPHVHGKIITVFQTLPGFTTSDGYKLAAERNGY